MDLPLLFEEVRYVDRPVTDLEEDEELEQLVTIRTNRGVHLLVLVHGFQGCHSDVSTIGNVFKLLFPDIEYFFSAANEDDTLGDIQSMGEKFAREVQSVINKLPPDKVLTKLSFIGYSLGGVIVRAGLPLLAEYKRYMHTLMTMGCPHLGCLVHNSQLVDAGLSIIKDWSKSACLSQLAMLDNKDYGKTFMYKLSNAPVLFQPRK